MKHPGNRKKYFSGSSLTLFSFLLAVTDRLKGTYFQAVQRQTFDIEFVRAR